MTRTLYAGMAGDTDEGRFVSAGLYRSNDGGAWRRIDGSFEDPPEVHAILIDPRRPERVLIGTQNGIFRSNDRGDSWRRLSAPVPDNAVWSLIRDPTDLDVVLAGYEPAALFRSADDGENFRGVPVMSFL